MFVIVAIIIMCYLGWIGVLFLIWVLLQRAGVTSDFWIMAGTLSAGLGPAILFGGSALAFRQLSEAARGRHLGVADRLFEELNSHENIEARRWLFQHLSDDPKESIATLSDEGRSAIKQVLNSLDRVAFLTQEGWIPEEMVMPWMNSMIVKAWAKLEPYIEYESRRRHEPDFYQNVRTLARRCVAWRAKHLPEAKFTWLDDAL
jgi:hypothetical protein